ncbi:MAG: 1-(5-phosphoribosyl)-5-[(5-phosphoribosylamino)methylideneamino]imidazole-4-carboxamide isomerase [Halanaerobiaceae bacterium]
MEVIPAIDIKNGRCVRLIQGDFNKEKVYGENPVQMALHWENQGARRIHIVDLDGAKEGVPRNLSLIKDLVKAVKIPVQLGGGIRSLEIMKKYLELGVDRVIVGTLALKNPDLVEKSIKLLGEDKIVAGVDAKKGKVAVEGWLETSEKKIKEVILDLKKRGVKTFIYTDISRDGMLSGPDIEGLEQLIQLNDIEIIASGGVSSGKDLNQLEKIGIDKAVVGKALYDGRLKTDNLWK